MRRLMILCGCMLLGVTAARGAITEPTQTNLTAVIAVDSDANTTTAMYSVGLEVGAEFAQGWLFPLPPGSTLLPSVPASLRQLLDWSSDFGIGSAPDLCDLSPIYTIGEGQPLRPQYEESPIDEITLLNADDAAAALADAGMALDDAQREALADYEAEGWSFAWLQVETRELGRVNFDNWFVQLLPFVVIEYPGTTPILPMRFHASSAQTYEEGYDAAGVVSVQAFVFANEPYLPDNYTRLTPELGDLRSGQHNLQGMPFLNARPAVNFDQPYYDYYDNLREAVQAMPTGRGYSYEFSGAVREASDYWRENFSDAAAVLDSLSGQYPIMTRIQTFLDPAQSAPDMTFAPALYLSDDEREDYALATFDYYDPLLYWGCSSRTISTIDLEARLPDARTYIDALNLHVAHPDDWRLTVLGHPQRLEDAIYVFAPREVEMTDLADAERGISDLPMMVIGRTQRLLVAEVGSRETANTAWDWFTRSTIAPFTNPVFISSKVYLPRGLTVAELAEDDPQPLSVNVVQAGIYAPADDLAANELRYTQLLRYLDTRQYLLSPELQHTLYLGNIGGSTVGIGYPSDWTEHYINFSDYIMISPTESDGSPPFIRLMPMRVAEGEPLSLYGVTVPADVTQPPIAFEAEGRRGFLLYSGGVHNHPIIEFSAPIDRYDEYAPLLETMLAAVQRSDARAGRR